MNLSGLLPDLRSALEEHGLAARLDGGTPLLLGLPDGAKAAVVATLASTGRPVLVVSPRPDRAAALAEEVASWLGDSERVYLFPEREALPYERLAPDPLVLRDRLRTLYALRDALGPLVVVASGQAVAQRTLAPEELVAGSERLTVGGRLAPEAFLRRLVQRGYRLTSLVDMPGQASRRGGIIDVFPPVEELPLRIELLGDQVESIRSFRPDTQRSTGRLEEATVGPAREVLLPSSETDAFLSRLDLSTCPPGRTAARGRFERETELLAAGEGFDDDYFYTPFLARGTLLDFLPPDALLVWDEPADLAPVLEEQDSEVLAVREEMVGRGELPAGLPLPHLPWPELRALLESHRRRIDLSRWASGEERPPQADPPPALRRRTGLRRPPARPRRRAVCRRRPPRARPAGLAAGGAPLGGPERAGARHRRGLRHRGAAARRGAGPGAGLPAPGLGPPGRRSIPHPAHGQRGLRLRQAATPGAPHGSPIARPSWPSSRRTTTWCTSSTASPDSPA